MHLITDDTPRSGQSLTLQVDGDALTIKVGTSCFGALRHLHKLIPEPFRFRLRSHFRSQIARAPAWRLSAKPRLYAMSRRCCASTAEAAFSMHSRVTDRCIMTGKRVLNWETVEDARRLK